MTNDRLYLEDILEAIERIQKYTAAGLDPLEYNELVQAWVVHYVQIIGEAARSITQDFRLRHPEVPWGSMIATRNIIVHHYFDVDVPTVRSVVERDLPDLKRKVEVMLQSFQGDK